MTLTYNLKGITDSMNQDLITLALKELQMASKKSEQPNITEMTQLLPEWHGYGSILGWMVTVKLVFQDKNREINCG